MKHISLFLAVVIMVFGCSSTVPTKTVIKNTSFEIKCDTFYYRGVDEEDGSYYLIEEIVCDTIPKYEYVLGRMG